MLWNLVGQNYIALHSTIGQKSLQAHIFYLDESSVSLNQCFISLGFECGPLAISIFKHRHHFSSSSASAMRSPMGDHMTWSSCPPLELQAPDWKALKPSHLLQGFVPAMALLGAVLLWLQLNLIAVLNPLVCLYWPQPCLDPWLHVLEPGLIPMALDSTQANPRLTANHYDCLYRNQHLYLW